MSADINSGNPLKPDFANKGAPNERSLPEGSVFTLLTGEAVLVPPSDVTPPLIPIIRQEFSLIEIGGKPYRVVGNKVGYFSFLMFLADASNNMPQQHLVAKSILSPSGFLDTDNPIFSEEIINSLADNISAQQGDNYDPFSLLPTIIDALARFLPYGISNDDLRINLQYLFTYHFEQIAPEFTGRSDNTDLKVRREYGQKVVTALQKAVISFASPKNTIANAIREHANLQRRTWLREEALLRLLRAQKVPHILQSRGLAFNQDTGELYSLTERVAGGDLRLAITGAYGNIQQRCSWFRAIAETIQAAHNIEIVHGDIKPENVLLTTNGDIYVIDWGLAKMLSGSEAGYLSGHGTRIYGAPELTAGEQPTKASDIFALGVMLQEFWTGHLAETLNESEFVVDPRFSSSQMHESIGRIVKKATSPDPNDRYHSVEEMFEDILRTQARELFF